jgi:hypothetical protein
VAFVAVCLPVSLVGPASGNGNAYIPCYILGVLLGLSAATGLSYLVVRRFFPTDKDRREGGEP